MRTFSFADIEKWIASADAKIYGDRSAVCFTRAATPAEADQRAIAWIGEAAPDAAQLLAQCRASLIITHAKWVVQAGAAPAGTCVVATAQPRLLFARIVNALLVPAPHPGVHPTAFVHPGASVAASAYIGAFAYVGAARIGEGSLIEGHCHIDDGVEIGRRCTLGAHSAIGVRGSGYAKSEHGWLPFPQLGTVIIEDDVDIGANAYVARGSLGETRIMRGAKIGLAACIGHNTRIGERCMVLASALVGGGTVLDRDVWVSIGAVLRDGITVGAGARILMGAVVHKNVPARAVVAGNPGREIKSPSEPGS